MRLSAAQIEVIRHMSMHVFGKLGKVHVPLHPGKNQRGFTLVELIAVMVIVGIIAAVAVPRFFDRGSFDDRAFHDQVVSTLRYAQKAAIAQRRFVCVNIAGNVVTLSYDATPPSATHTVATPGCGSDLVNPLTGVTPYTLANTQGVAVSAAVFNFDALGRSSALQSITVGSIATPITVVAETGYVN